MGRMVLWFNTRDDAFIPVLLQDFWCALFCKAHSFGCSVFIYITLTKMLTFREAINFVTGRRWGALSTTGDWKNSLIPGSATD